MKKKIFGLILALMVLAIMPVSAEEINKFYAEAGDNVKVEDVVHADSAIYGNVVDLIGNLDGIGFIAGNTVNLNGNLEYAFIAGNVITVNSKVERSAYIAGNAITIDKDASIGRDLFIAGSDVNISGNLNRDVNAAGSKVVITSTAKIKGDISISADTIIVEKGAYIEGTLSYNETAKADISKESSLTSVKTYTVTEEEAKSNVGSILISIANILVVFAVTTLVFPQDILKRGKTNYLKSFGIGLLILLCTPVIAIFLLISSIGISLDLILIALYAICLYLSYITFGVLLGHLLIEKLIKKDASILLKGLIGIILLKLIVLIPAIGGMISLIAICIGLALIISLLEDKKEDKVIEAKIKEKKTTKTEKSN